MRLTSARSSFTSILGHLEPTDGGLPGERLGLLDQVLELAQLPALHFQFVGAHCVYLLLYWDQAAGWAGLR